MLILKLISAIAGFVLIYKHQQDAYGDYGHFYSPHTYIGIITLALYWFQWIAGVFLYLVPWESFLSKDDLMRMGKLKGGFIQSHRAIGKFEIVPNRTLIIFPVVH